MKGCTFIKKIVHQCLICKKFEGKPCLGPSPPPLPKFRLKEDHPFTYTGVDFAGPLYIKDGGAADTRFGSVSIYHVLRDHLEIVPDMIHSKPEALLGTPRLTKKVCIRQWQDL